MHNPAVADAEPGGGRRKARWWPMQSPAPTAATDAKSAPNFCVTQRTWCSMFAQPAPSKSSRSLVYLRCKHTLTGLAAQRKMPTVEDSCDT